MISMRTKLRARCSGTVYTQIRNNGLLIAASENISPHRGSEEEIYVL